jgi:hypothetical protein
MGYKLHGASVVKGIDGLALTPMSPRVWEIERNISLNTCGEHPAVDSCVSSYNCQDISSLINNEFL